MKKLLSILMASSMLFSTASVISVSATANKIASAQAVVDKEASSQKQFFKSYSDSKDTTETIKAGEFTSEDGAYKYRVIVTEKDYFARFEKLIKSNVKTFKIPHKLGGAKVISVSPSAFEGLNKLESVTLGKYVYTIDSNAFKGCTSLSKINLDNVADFGPKSFSGCSSLKSIDLTKGHKKDFIRIRNRAFYNCKNLKKVKIYDEVLIGAKAFGFITPKKKVRGFKMILSTNDSVGDNDYTKDGIGYCHEHNFKCTYNLNSSDTKKLYMWAGFAGKLTVDNKSLTKWKSSNNKVVKIDSKGNFIILKKGKVTLTAAKANGKKYRKTVSVKNNPQLSEPKITVKKGSIYPIEITGKANNINNKYSVSKTAKIISKKTSHTLKIKGIKKGKTTLKITVNGFVLKLKVTVK